MTGGILGLLVGKAIEVGNLGGNPGMPWKSLAAAMACWLGELSPLLGLDDLSLDCEECLFLLLRFSG